MENISDLYYIGIILDAGTSNIINTGFLLCVIINVLYLADIAAIIASWATF